MPVTLGAKKEHGFDEPLGLMSDCHQRIERFLDVIGRVLELRGDKPLEPNEREALEAALRYFATAAPRHTADEEDSLFPRLRELQTPDAKAAMARIDALEADHRAVEQLHAEVEHWCRRWMELGRLASPQVGRLRRVLTVLVETYRRHIAVEEEEVFPLAARVLGSSALAQVGCEMERRRGLSARGA